MSKWVEHIRDFAKRNNLTYGCALSDPKCSEEYRIKFPKPAKKGKKGKKLDLSKTEFVPLEEAEMDTEPKTKMVVEKKPPAEYPKLIDELISRTKEFLKKVNSSSNKGDLENELRELKKVGRDKVGNIYLKESHQYFLSKYGKDYHSFHPTAHKDKYWNIVDKLLPMWDEAEEKIKKLPAAKAPEPAAKAPRNKIQKYMFVADMKKVDKYLDKNYNKEFDQIFLDDVMAKGKSSNPNAKFYNKQQWNAQW
jgi:hypothetical protein